MRQWWSRGLMVAGVTALLVTAAAPGVGAAAESELRLRPSAEAWYRGAVVGDGSALCVLPCAAPANPYPVKTLHVGRSGGGESARTYLTLDLSAVPDEATIRQAALRLPVASDAGTESPETATIRACLATGRVEPVEAGDAEEAPAVDCGTTAEAEFADGVFSLDLAPFTTLGRDAVSLALLPATEGGDWHVAFHGRDREAEGAQPITAVVRYRLTAAGAGGMQSADPDPSDDGFEGGSGSPSLTSADEPVSETTEPGVLEPVLSPETPEEGAAAGPQGAPGVPGGNTLPVAAGGYAYPVVWLLPLLLLGVGTLVVRGLTSDYEVDAAALESVRD